MSHTFKDTFQGMPIMPGVLQIEAMAQAGGILVLQYFKPSEDYDTYLLSVDKCRFRKKVVPGDTMLINVNFSASIKMGITSVYINEFMPYYSLGGKFSF